MSQVANTRTHKLALISTSRTCISDCSLTLRNRECVRIWRLSVSEVIALHSCITSSNSRPKKFSASLQRDSAKDQEASPKDNLTLISKQSSPIFLMRRATSQPTLLSREWPLGRKTSYRLSSSQASHSVQTNTSRRWSQCNRLLEKKQRHQRED